MALQATTVWELRSDGSDNNGGGYTSGGTDYSQQAAAELNPTDLAMAQSSTTLTSATGGFTSAMVGNVIQITAGTNFDTGWYEITAYTNTNTVTLDRTAASGGNGSSGTGYVGGALASFGIIGKICTDHGVAGWTFYVKNGTYLCSTTSTNVSGGFIDLSGSYDKALTIKGYDTDRTGDWGTNRPTMDANGQNANDYMIESDCNAAGEAFVLQNVIVDCDSGADLNGVNGGGSQYAKLYYVDILNVGTGEVGVLSAACVRCKSEGSGTRGFFTCICYGCISIGHTKGYDTSYCVCCIADGCTSGFYDSYLAVNCTSYNSGGDGFDFADRGTLHINCYAGENGAYGFDLNGSAALYNCAGYSNTSGNVNGGPAVDIGFNSSITGQPLTDPGNDDFYPDNTANEGQELRAGGLGVYGQSGSSAHGIDIGAVQHADPAGGDGGVQLGPFSAGAWR